MTADTVKGSVSRLELVEVGRRRRWSVKEKVRIVAESRAAPRQLSATARRHGMSRSLLTNWRRAYRDRRLAGAAEPAFVPVRVRVDAPLPPAAD